MQETLRFKGGASAADLAKVVEDLRALKNRVFGMEVARLDQERADAISAAMEQANASGGKLKPEEARKFAEAECRRNREMVEARFRRLDLGLEALKAFVQEAVDIEDARRRAEEAAGGLEDEKSKIETIRREFDVKKNNLDLELREVAKEREELERKTRELEEKIGNLDIVKRARELDEREKDLQADQEAYNEELAKVARMREELNRDFDNLGKMRAEIDAEREKLVEKTIAGLLEGFEKTVRKMFGAER